GIDPATGAVMLKHFGAGNTVTPNDRRVYGSPDPKYIVGMGNTFSYKKLSLSFFFTRNFGNKLFNQTMATYTVPYANSVMISNVFSGAQNYWSPSNPTS